MEEYINYWLKNPKKFLKMIKDTPNDSELGSKMRKLSWEINEDKNERDDKWLVEQYNRNRDPKDWISNIGEI